MCYRQSRLRAVLAIVAWICILCLAGCASSEPPSACPPSDRGCRDAEYVLRETEALLQLASEDPNGEEPFALVNKGNGCWTLFQEQMAQATPYTLNVLLNAQALPNPERDVMRVLLEVDFASGERAVVWWYAGGIALCRVDHDE